MPYALDQRKQLRKSLRHARNSLSKAQQHDAANALSQQWHSLLSALKLSQLEAAAFYLSHDGEISPHYLAELCWSNQITTFLPVLSEQSLTFAEYKQDSQWRTNRFGIREPVDTLMLTPMQLDLVCLPLVGFDAKGGRLGMGGGFYDRAFATATAGQKPYLVGLAHDCQQVDHLEVESWDVPLDAILTPSELILTTRT